MGFQVSVHPPQIPRFPPGCHPTSREIWASSQTCQAGKVPGSKVYKLLTAVGGFSTKPFEICASQIGSCPQVKIKYHCQTPLTVTVLTGHEIQLPSKHVKASSIGNFPLPHRLLVQFYEFQRWMGCSMFVAHLPRIPPNSNYHFARVLLYAWPVNLTPFTISTIFTNYITSFSPKKNWDPSFPPQQNSPQVAHRKLHLSTLRPYASESWRLSKIPSVPMSTTSPSSTSEATQMSRFPNSVQHKASQKTGCF